MQRYGMTIPFDGIALADQRDWIAELVDLGYVRGMLNKLGEIERNEPASAEFAQILRHHARQFQFDAMKQILREARDATGHS